MELSGPKIKNFVIFFQERKNSYISGNGTFWPLSYIFSKIFFLYFVKWSFLALRFKHFLYFITPNSKFFLEKISYAFFQKKTHSERIS